MEIFRSSPLTKTALLVLVITAAHLCGPGATAAVLVADADLPLKTVTAFVIADTTGAGRHELVATTPDGIFVLVPDEELSTWTVLTHVPPLPAPATAVAVADFIGDGVPSIAVGTAQAGAVYLLRWTGFDWVVAAQTGYLWSSVSALSAADLSGDGRPELVVADAGGGVTIFAWNDAQKTLAAVWQWPRAWGRAVATSVTRLPGLAHPALVVADDQGRISVWTWPMAQPVAQAFVWGTPTALAVADVLGTGPQVVVSTAEQLLYRFTWEQSRLVQATTPLSDPQLPFSYLMRWRWSDDTADRLLAYNDAGLGVWRLTAGSLARMDDGWSNPPLAVAGWPGRETLIVLERTQADGGTLRTWTRQPSGYFRLIIDGRTVTLQDPPRLEQGRVMLSARDWAAALGLQLYWDAAAQRLTAVGRGTYAMLTMGERLVTTPAGIRSASAAPVLQDGRSYVPPEFPVWFGATYEWDARRRVLSVATGD